MMAPFVARIRLHLIKSCAGTDVPQAYLDVDGFVHDRDLVLVEPDGLFMSQRDFPRMALIRPHLGRLEALGRLQHSGILVVRAPSMPDLSVAFFHHQSDLNMPRTVRIHEDDGWGCDMGLEAAEWFGAFLANPCALVRMVHHARLHHSSVLDESFEVRGRDGYPVHILGAPSCDDLNHRASAYTPPENFRANILIGGINPYEEDTWVGRRICIGKAVMRVVKLNQRCPIPTVDQNVGELADDPWREEPLRTLLTYREAPEGGVTLGVNCELDIPGDIHRGDTVEILA